MKEYKYHWDGIIVGYSLSALIYAFYSGMPVVGYMSSAPWDFEKLPRMELSKYGMGKGSQTHQIGLWNYLYTLLSMGGQLPFADNAATIRRTDNELVVTTNNRYRVMRTQYNTLWVFDDHGIEGMPEIIKPCETYRVVDWFNVRSGMRHGESLLMYPSEDFVRNIYFYPSPRLCGHHPDKKDVCSESFLLEEDLDKFEYSSTYARFRTMERMKDVGIRGASNGMDAYGRQKHYALKIEFDKRRKRRTNMHLYRVQEGIVYNRIQPHALLEECIQGASRLSKPKPANPYIPKVLLTS